VTVKITLFQKHEHAGEMTSVGSVQQRSLCATQFGDVIVCTISLNAMVAPRELQIGTAMYIRLLDRFYLPEPHDAATTDAFFTRIADDYDGLIDAERNVSNLVNLLREIVTRSDGAGRHMRFLDFGCGTGLSKVALARIGDSTTNIDLLGFDRCTRMREAAKHRGLQVLPAAACADLQNLGESERFDGVVASYVFHFGVEGGCFNALHAVLRRGGKLAGNYHKATNEALRQLDVTANTAGFRLEERFTDPDHGSISIFRS
jgi:predicted TPR repeat methyltransferase